MEKFYNLEARCKIVNIFLSICSKEPSHCDGSFDYPQDMFWLRIGKPDELYMKINR